MNWYGSYSSRFRAYVVSEETWDDLLEIGKVESLDIAWDVTSDALQDGSMQVVGERPDGWVRIYLEADGEGELARVPVATMMATTNERSITGITYAARTSLSSVLQEASQTPLPLGFFAPKGADPARFASVLLRDYCRCPVEIATSGAKLPGTIVAENGDTPVTFAKTVLDGTGLRIAIDGRGRVRIHGDDSVASLDSARIYADGITDKTDAGVRTIAYSRPFNPGIEAGSTVSLFVPEHGIAGLFTVTSQRLVDDCTIQEVAAHGIAQHR